MKTESTWVGCFPGEMVQKVEQMATEVILGAPTSVRGGQHESQGRSRIRC